MDGDLKDKFIIGIILIKFDYVKGEGGKKDGRNISKFIFRCKIRIYS